MPESYPSHWFPHPTAAERARRELEEAVNAALLVLRHDGRHHTADRLEAALKEITEKDIAPK